MELPPPLLEARDLLTEVLAFLLNTELGILTAVNESFKVPTSSCSTVEM